MPIVLPTPTIGLASGSPEYVLPGSGQSIIGGVESYYVYGDLVMNQRKNLDTYIIKEIDGLIDADLRDSRENVPQEHGEHVFSSWYGGRTIVLTGQIRAHNIHKLRDMQEALKRTFAGTTEQPLRIVSPYATAPHHSFVGMFESPSVSINCKKSQPLQMRESQTNFKFTREFQITLRASNPFFLSDYVANFSQSTITSPHSWGMVNKGNYKAGPRIVLTGPMTNPSLVNNLNGETLSLTAAIGAGSTRTIDVAERSLIDQTGANKFSELNASSDWITVEPGVNTFTLTYTAGTTATAVSMSMNHTWI
jgi:hypothetical protein